MTKLIEDYALLSDCHSAALVGRDGSIDWLCFPKFDSPSCFSALLGTKNHGHWMISPTDEFKVERNYIDGTMVLETTFTTSTGSCRLTDCMVIGDSSPTLIRHIKGIEGKVNLQMLFTIRFDYGTIIPWVRKNEAKNGIHAVGGPDAVVLYSPVPLEGKNMHTASSFTVEKDTDLYFSIIWYPSHLSMPAFPKDPYGDICETRDWWKRWSDKCQYDGFDKENVKRSLLTLKALTYHPTGAIVAAPTTSLPETLGGIRNWDYRYGWIRDSSLTLLSLLKAGYKEEAMCWEDWLLRSIAGTPSQVNIMYGIHGERRLTEIELEELPGYENSRPVRIGNDAFRQFQLDVFGELMSTTFLGRKYGLAINENTWRIEKKMIEYLCQHWREPDEGIWEVRGPKQHFTHSKMMAWVALNYAVKSVEEFHLEGDTDYWMKLRDEIHQDICEKAWNSELNSFVQSYGSRELDASLLVMPLVGFLPITDSRIVGTIEAIQNHLMEDGFILRYSNYNHKDGLHGKEGTFLACSFWLVRNLSLLGRHQEAHDLYHRLISIKNDVGLFAEEYLAGEKRMVGNFPQAFSHLTQISAAMELDKHLKAQETHSNWQHPPSAPPSSPISPYA